MKGPHKGRRGHWLGSQVHGAAGRLADHCALVGGVGDTTCRHTGSQRSRGLEPGHGQGWTRRVRPVRERGCTRGSLPGPALLGGVRRSCRDIRAERTDPIRLRKEQSPLLRILSKSQQD